MLFQVGAHQNVHGKHPHNGKVIMEYEKKSTEILKVVKKKMNVYRARPHFSRT